MNTEHHSLNQVAMIHGLYLGLALILNTLIFYITGNPFSPYSGYLTYALILAGAGYAMWSFASMNTEEGLPYSRALGLGTLTSLFGSVLFGFFTFILYKYIDEGLIGKMLEFMETKLMEQGLKDETAEGFLAAYRKMTTPTFLSISQVISITIIGFIFSLILAIFLKKEPANPFYEIDNENEEEEEE